MADQPKINPTEEQQKRIDAAKQKLADAKEARAKTAEQQEATSAGKPTPTQEENDLAKLGAYLPEHEADGSPVTDPNAPQTKQMEPKRGGQYQTRAATPQRSTDT